MREFFTRNNGYGTAAIPETLWIDAYEAAHRVGLIVAQVNGWSFADTARDYLTVQRLTEVQHPLTTDVCHTHSSACVSQVVY